ncbi:hypothetical protein [Longimicrobium sp.]|jgi:hypothetical protein|uniref:hypothetical protein n=1 Tax=Longimicrobium sp. TaxID=2029185 RepID=UPI002ED7F2FA
MNRRALFRGLVLTATLLASVATGACDSVFAVLTGVYRGPRPAHENIESEVVIVRSINRQPSGVALLILDRVRYSENGDPHDVNRVVEALTTQVQSAFDALNVRVGDRLVVSTSFIQVGETGDLREVPNWPGHDYPEYPIGVHYLTAVAKAAP